MSTEKSQNPAVSEPTTAEVVEATEAMIEDHARAESIRELFDKCRATGLFIPASVKGKLADRLDGEGKVKAIDGKVLIDGESIKGNKGWHLPWEVIAHLGAVAAWAALNPEDGLEFALGTRRGQLASVAKSEGITLSVEDLKDM